MTECRAWSYIYASPSILYVLMAIVDAMNNWLIDYHHAYLLRLLSLLSLVVLFAFAMPSLWLLVVTWFRTAKRFAQLVLHRTRSPQGRIS